MKLKWNLKRTTAVLAMLYGLATLAFASYAYDLQRNWYQQAANNRGTPDAEVAQLISYGSSQDDLDAALRRFADTMGWVDSFVMPVTVDRPMATAPIVAGSNRQLNGQDWHTIDRWYNQDWVGTIGKGFSGPDGQLYTVVAVRRPGDLPWPFFQQVAETAAVAAWLAVATWLYFDASDRERSRAFGWLVLGLLGGPVGLAIWLISRPTHPAAVSVAPTASAAPTASVAATIPVTPTASAVPAAGSTAAVEEQPLAPRDDEVQAAGEIICPDCGGHGPSGTAFCVRCGHPLQPICPECRHPVALDWAYCGACGADLSE